MSSETDRFWSKVDRRGDDECWLWTGVRTGGRTGDAYGYFRISRPRRHVYAHRYAYCAGNGTDIRDLDRKTVIRHRCDTPICCNPSHLEIGEQKHNAQDMVDRGRSLRGERAPSHRLQEAEVHEIRRLLASHMKHRDIAAIYGVSRATISVINSGRTWGWLVSDNDNEPAAELAAAII